MKDLAPLAVTLIAGSARQHLFGDVPKTLGIRSGHVVLKPGESIGEHSTKEKEEVLVILEGAGEVSSDKGRPLAVRSDHAVYIPPRTKHNVKNTGIGMLRYVYVVSPTQTEDT